MQYNPDGGRVCLFLSFILIYYQTMKPHFNYLKAFSKQNAPVSFDPINLWNANWDCQSPVASWSLGCGRNQLLVKDFEKSFC